MLSDLSMRKLRLRNRKMGLLPSQSELLNVMIHMMTFRMIEYLGNHLGINFLPLRI